MNRRDLMSSPISWSNSSSACLRRRLARVCVAQRHPHRPKPTGDGSRLSCREHVQEWLVCSIVTAYITRGILETSEASFSEPEEPLLPPGGKVSIQGHLQTTVSGRGQNKAAPRVGTTVAGPGLLAADSPKTLLALKAFSQRGHGRSQKRASDLDLALPSPHDLIRGVDSGEADWSL